MKSALIQKATVLTVSLGIILFVFTAKSFAHYPWIQLDRFHPKEGEKLDLTIGFGHHFPSLTRFLNHKRIQDINIYNHNKQKLSMQTSSKFHFISKNKLNKGSYIVSSFAPNFFTETTSGYKRRSKGGLSNVIECEQNNWCMKSIVNVGNFQEDVDIEVGHPIEIIPLKNPLALERGEALPIRIILNGKPLQEEKVRATYMGFTSGEKEFAQTVKTDEKGRAEIKLTNRGIWLIRAYSKSPYPNKEVCDIKEFIASLTFRME